MLTKIRIQNFKQFDDVEIELGPVTVLIGPNNSGKTTILQALMLWHTHNIYGMQLGRSALGWSEGQHYIYIHELYASPVSGVDLLWRNKTDEPNPIDIDVSGVMEGKEFTFSISFNYVDYKSISYGPPRVLGERELDHLEIPILFLSSNTHFPVKEDRLQTGTIERYINEGRAFEVLSNMCFKVYEEGIYWQTLVNHIRSLFGVEIYRPFFVSSTGQLVLSYTDHNGIRFDIASAGRGMLQTLFMLTYMYYHPVSVLLLDEPDTHLEILLQRQIYALLKEVAEQTKSQIILTTHSPEIMDEAFNREDKIIAFTGKPIAINYSDKVQATREKRQIAKSLREIPFADYYKALQKGWILYLEDYTDFDILRAFANKLGHPSAHALGTAFVKYLHGNDYGKAASHLEGIRYMFDHVRGVVLLDSLLKQHPSSKTMQVLTWQHREIENYLCQPPTLLAFAEDGDLDGSRKQVMFDILKDEIPPIAYDDPKASFWKDSQVSVVFLDRVFQRYTEVLGRGHFLPKKSFHKLVKHIPANLIDPEVIEKLDAIWDIAKDAPNT